MPGEFLFYLFILKDLLIYFREREKKQEGEGERESSSGLPAERGGQHGWGSIPGP